MVSKDVAASSPTARELDDIQSFDEFKTLMSDYGQDIIDSVDILAGGFREIEKATLVGQPFVILDWSERTDETTQRSYAFVKLMTKDNVKHWFTDGGTGIYAQLKEAYAKTGRSAGIMCARGLTRSDYTFVNDKGQNEKGTTFYIAS